MPENMTPFERISAAHNLLDTLTEATGRQKCGIICVLDDILNQINNDILIMEAKLKDKEGEAQPEIKLEVVPEPEVEEKQ